MNSANGLQAPRDPSHHHDGNLHRFNAAQPAGPGYYGHFQQGQAPPQQPHQPNPPHHQNQQVLINRLIMENNQLRFQAQQDQIAAHFWKTVSEKLGADKNALIKEQERLRKCYCEYSLENQRMKLRMDGMEEELGRYRRGNCSSVPGPSSQPTHNGAICEALHPRAIKLENLEEQEEPEDGLMVEAHVLVEHPLMAEEAEDTDEEEEKARTGGLREGATLEEAKEFHRLKYSGEFLEGRKLECYLFDEAGNGPIPQKKTRAHTANTFYLNQTKGVQRPNGSRKRRNLKDEVDVQKWMKDWRKMQDRQKEQIRDGLIKFEKPKNSTKIKKEPK